jgi:hypothetical protein
MKRFLRWLFSWRNARRVLIGIAVLVTFYAVFCAEEDWRGKRDWNRYRQQLEARGEQLDLSAFTPKPVPDDQNFAMTPFVQSWLADRNGFQKRWADNYSRVSLKGTERQQFLDLAAWAAAFGAIRAGETNPMLAASGKLDFESRAKAAPAVLEGLRTNEAVLAELRAASRRPYSRYPLVYDMDDPWSILLPHLGNIRAACKRLQLRACAELAVGRSDDALEDVKLMLYLADSVKDEPFLISYLVRIVCLQLAIQPVWEGLAEHRWSDAQLEDLQEHFAKENFVADMKGPLDAERAAGVLTPKLIRREGVGSLLSMIGPDWRPVFDKRLANRLGPIIPSGWYSLEQLNYCRFYQLLLEGGFSAAPKRVFPSRIEANFLAMDRAFAGSSSFSYNLIHHRLIAQMLVPALNVIIRRAASAQTAADQAALACALERYRLANDQFPESLDALVPRFMSALPNDVITGEPYKYRRTPDGQFVLYSVGWNEKDDGGVPGDTLFDEKKGDWVWQYPNPP